MNALLRRIGAGLTALIFAFAPFHALAQVGAPVVGASKNYNAAAPLPVASGGTGSATAQTAAAALGVPWVLSQSGLPFVILSSGSVDATGNITAITALPTAFPNAYCYFPANILATAIAAAWYYCTFSTTTAGIAFLNTYASGNPTIPASPTAVTDGKGAYTGVITEITGPTVTLAAGSMGPNGSLRIQARFSATNNADVKTPRVKLGTTNFAGFVMTSLLNADALILIQNRGVATRQVGIVGASTYFGIGSSASARTYGNIDTGSSQSVAISLQSATATDNLILEGYLAEVLYAP